MELKDFIKTKKTQRFLETQYHWIRTKNYVLEEIKEKIENWVADGCSEKEIHDNAISYILRNYEPFTKDIQEKTTKLMIKWGLK